MREGDFFCITGQTVMYEKVGCREGVFFDDKMKEERFFFVLLHNNRKADDGIIN